jgi:hypothetical protein
MDAIDIRIEEDGTISMKTSAISATNHLSADKLLEDLEQMIGGPVIKIHDPDAKQHAHIHTHEHAHAGGHHH